MEKKIYSKPHLSNYTIKLNSFMITSGAVPGGSIIIDGYKDIDQCIQINGAVSDQALINMIKNSDDKKLVSTVDQGNPAENESCENTTLQAMCGYGATVEILDELNGLFKITFSETRNNDCNTGGGGGRPGKH